MCLRGGWARMSGQPRLTLVQRQQKLLEERGFSKPKSTGGCSDDFNKRQDAHLARTGRGNAIAASRKKAEMLEDDDGPSAGDDSASVYSRFSHAPSLHPSMAGSMMSEACHPETIGAGDDTKYWDFQHRSVEKQDLGHRCRECRMPFTTIGDPLTERRGARVSMRYHAACFSGYADPRSQATSSHHAGRHAGTQLEAAPGAKAGSKMRTSQHFEGGGATRGGRNMPPTSTLGSGAGKTGMGLSMGSNGFGAKSSRGATCAEWAQATASASSGASSGLSEAALRRHDQTQEAQVGAAQAAVAKLAFETITE